MSSLVLYGQSNLLLLEVASTQNPAARVNHKLTEISEGTNMFLNVMHNLNHSDQRSLHASLGRQVRSPARGLIAPCSQTMNRPYRC